MKEDVTFWNWLKAWSDDHSGLIVLAALSLPMLFACLRIACAPKRWDRLEGYFNDPAFYPMLLERYKTGGGEAYFVILRRISLFAARVYGRRLFSRQAFGVCLSLGCLYSILAMLLAWVVANVWQPGGLELYRDIASPLDRLWQLTILTLSFFPAFWLIAKFDSLSLSIEAKLESSLGSLSARTSFPPKTVPMMIPIVSAGGVLGFCSVFGAVFGVTLAGTLVVSSNVVLGVAAAVAFVAANPFAIAIVGAIAVAVVGAVAIAFAVTGDPEAASILICLYVILPTFNALMDFLSIAATRWFLRRVTKKRPSAGTILLGVCGDLIVAAACFSLLLGSLVCALEAWGQLSPATVPFDWRAYWEALEQDKAQGIALYVMIGTTLLPTIIHVAAGLGAILTHKRRQLRSVARALEAQITLGVPFPAIEQDAHVAQIRRATFWGYGSAALGVVLFSYGLGVLAVEVTF